MSTEEIIIGTLKKMGHSPEFLSPNERKAVSEVIERGRAYGYGNMIAWLATAWAVELRGQGLKEKVAIEHASNCGPYTLPPQP